MKCDVLIIGAGPASLFAAHELANNSDLNIIIVDKGGDIKHRICPIESIGYCTHCKPCHIMCGVGGAGGLSDGTINLHPAIGGDLAKICEDEDYAWQLIYEVDKILLSYGMPDEIKLAKKEKAMKLKEKAIKSGLVFFPIVQRHIGTDRTIELIKNIKNALEKKGVKFLLWTEAKKIKDKKVLVKKGVKEYYIEYKYLILAPGRIGSKWLREIAKEISLDAVHNPVDIGVRVELPYEIFKEATEINHDPKFYLYTKKYNDFVRTFCCNPKGFVVKEDYNGYIGVNGHSLAYEKSNNTNFAFLNRIELTEPFEDTSEYAIHIAKSFYKLGSKKPILQKLGDLRAGRRSTAKRISRSYVVPSLKDHTPGDISMAMPARIVYNIVEGLEKLDSVFKGIANDDTLLYAPEIKYYAMRIKTNKDMESNIKNIYAIGDGSGNSRDISNAAATGLLAARSILSKESFKCKGKEKRNFKEILYNYV